MRFVRADYQSYTDLPWQKERVLNCWQWFSKAGDIAAELKIDAETISRRLYDIRKIEAVWPNDLRGSTELSPE